MPQLSEAATVIRWVGSYPYVWFCAMEEARIMATINKGRARVRMVRLGSGQWFPVVEMIEEAA